MYPIFAVIITAILAVAGTAIYYRSQRPVKVVVHYNDGRSAEFFMMRPGSAEEVRQVLSTGQGAPANVTSVAVQKQLRSRTQVAGVDVDTITWVGDRDIYTRY